MTWLRGSEFRGVSVVEEKRREGDWASVGIAR